MTSSDEGMNKGKPRIQTMGENWHVVEDTVIETEQDYRQYEIHSIMEAPSKDQITIADRETDLLCFKELKILDLDLENAKFGVKIGCKLSDPRIQWVEKWATFETGFGQDTLTSTIVDDEGQNESLITQQYKY